MKKFFLLNRFLLAIILSAYSFSAIAHESCKIKDQSGSAEAYWCWNHKQKNTIRCYADVQYNDGTEGKVWGKTCYRSYADCWWSGKGKVEPDCSEDGN